MNDMFRKNKPCLAAIIVILIFMTGCSDTQEILSVSEVIQNAEALDGKTIRVRGEAYHWIEPSRETLWRWGGCVPISDPSYRQGVTTGWLALYDQIDPDDMRGYGAPHDDIGIKISETSFSCSGDFCKMTCPSFEVVSHGPMNSSAFCKYILGLSLFWRK